MANEDLLQFSRNSLASFASMLFPSFELAAHHSRLIAKLEDVEAGRCKRLMIFMPPRHGKSLLSTQLFPAWYLGRGPKRSIISATYSQDLSDDFGRATRNFANDPWTLATFPELELSADSNSMRRFSTTQGGSYYSVGRGGSITGRGADLLIVDDPIKDSEEARSPLIRHSLHAWYASVGYTRLQPQGAVVVIQTRWHHDDLAGWLLREHADEGWDVLDLPAIAEKNGDGRLEGEALWPERFSAEHLASIRRAVGGATWTALYQQRPTAEEGSVFRRDWWQRYSELPTFTRIILSLDTAYKTGRSNDFSVCTVWGEAATGYFLLDVWRARVEFPQLKRELARLALEWRPSAILIEDKASGQSLIQELRQATRFPVIPIQVDSDKISRAHAASPMVEAGRVFLPQSATWLADYLDELSQFPVAVHDDQTDSTTHALNYIRGKSSGLFELWRELASTVAKPQSLSDAQKNDAWPRSHVSKALKRLGPPRTSTCPECAAAVAQFAEGRWCCNLCQIKGIDAVA